MTEDNASVVKGRSWWRWYVVCQIVFLLLVCGGPVAYLGGVELLAHHDWAVTERYVEDLRRGAEQAIPPGSNKKAAAAWLASQGLAVSEWGARPGRQCHRGARHPPEQLGGILRGDTSLETYIHPTDVNIYVFLDRQGRVIKHQVTSFSYSW
jgi:hypothetical protein